MEGKSIAIQATLMCRFGAFWMAETLTYGGQEMNYRYKAVNKEKPSVCPYCGKKKFSRLVDTYTGELLDVRFGLCSVCRKSNYPSKEYAQKHLRAEIPSVRAYEQNLFGEHINTMDMSLVDKSHKHTGNFYKFLCENFPESKVNAAWDKYKMGVTKNGSVIYWQIDQHNSVFTGEVVSYMDNGKRDPSIDEWWTHNRMDGYNMRQVLFGLHLVSNDQAPVMVVEGAKNALIGAICFPEYIWTAVHSRGELNGKKLYAIRRHPIIAIPDIDALQDWTERAESLNKDGYSVTIVDFLETFSATDEEKKDVGFKGDIADLLLLRANPYELPDSPELSAIINKNPAVKNICLKWQLQVKPMQQSFGIIIDGNHCPDYTDPGQVFYHIERAHGHIARTPQEWMSRYASVAGFHSPKNPERFFADHASEYFTEEGGLYTFKFDVKFQELRPCSDGVPRYLAVDAL